MRLYTCLLLTVLLVSACSKIPAEGYYNRGAPESLLDVSSEVVNLSVASEPALDELTNWINQDHPSRAELYCDDQAPSCAAAKDVLDLYGVPAEHIPSAENMVTLVYERVLARDCMNRYIDNTINPYNLNHPTFGCSNTVNMVQMISDKQQIVRPNVMDLPDAKKATQSYENYLTKRAPAEQTGISDSLLQNARAD